MASTARSLETRVSALEDMVGLHGCVRRRTTSPSLNGAQITVLWDTEVIEDASHCSYNVGTAEVTVNTAGWYRVSYKANFQHTNGNTHLSTRMWVLLNNTTTLDYSLSYDYARQDSQAEYSSHSVSFIDYFDVNDIMEVQHDAASGSGSYGQGNASYDILGPEAQFSLEFIEP